MISSARHLQKILEQFFSALRQDGLRVELDPKDREFLVLESHDLFFLGMRGDLKRGGQAFSFDEERMVTRGDERIVETFEDAGPVMIDLRGLSVHEARGADDLSAENLPDALMSETNA